MLERFIERPVLSTVVSIIIIILGVLGIISLPIAQYPDIAPPTVNVSTTYTGANADVVLNSVIVPLEEQINGVDNMTYMTSTASNDGSAQINVFFKVGVNPDLAAVNVQNRVSKATSLLPIDVNNVGVTVAKKQNSMLLVFTIYSENPSFDETFLQNYTSINILPQIKRINGVGDARTFASHDYSMRIWLKPEVMAAYGLVPDDVILALNDQNIEAAPGSFGESGKQSFQYIIRYKGRLKNSTEFENIIIRSNPNGQILRLKDIARVELGALSYSSYSKSQGKPGIAVAIYQAAGSDAREVINDAKEILSEASKTFPSGVKYATLQDANEFLEASISNVIETLLEAFGLVFLVIFIFLHDIRSTFIHGIAVPVSIIGTFFFLKLFGYTINLLTLFALVLAIGIVVDDAIVIVEAVHAKLEKGASSTLAATKEAMSEVTTAIISITLVMSAVFLPVTFIDGSAGVFYKQFGITLAIAILISAVNALTLCPALCVVFLKAPSENELHKNKYLAKFGSVFDHGFDILTEWYRNAVRFFSIKKWIPISLILVFTALLFFFIKTTKTGFVPSEDQGTFYTDIMLPPSASLERTIAISNEVDSIISTIPTVKTRTRIVGQGSLGGVGSSYARVITKLKHWDDRKGTDIQSVIKSLSAKTNHIRDAKITIVQAPTVQGFALSGGFTFQVLDKTGGDIRTFYNITREFLEVLNKRPEIDYAITAFNPNFPQYLANVNVAKCKEAGVSVLSVMKTMQGYYGGEYVSNYNAYGKQFRVMVQADAQYRANPEGLNKIFVRNSKGVMSPISEYISLQRVFGPENITRFNLFTAISINGSPKAGFSTGDAINAIQEVAKEKLPVGYGYEFSGITREELSTGNQSIFVFILCLIFVYFLLCAQYESYILPLAVIFSLPVGLSGTFIFAKILNIDNNIYLQTSLIMLIGLLAKNAILVIQYSLDRRRKGMSIKQSALEGAVARVRPILMTSLAFIVGLLPLLFSTGAGAVGNHSIATGAIGGMVVGIVFGLLVIPVLFIMFQSLNEKISGGVKFSTAIENQPKVVL